MNRRQRDRNLQRHRRHSAERARLRQRRNTAEAAGAPREPRGPAREVKKAAIVQPLMEQRVASPPRRTEEPSLPSLGFGLERVGLLALRAPWLALALVVAITVALGFGLPKLRPNDAMSDLFRSDSVDYQRHAEMSRLFPSSEYDVLIVIEGQKLFEPQTLEAVRNLHLDLELVEPVQSVLSIFSMRDVPPTGEVPPAIFPEVMPEGDEFKTLLQKTEGHPLVKGKLMARDGPDGGLVVLVVSMSRDHITKHGIKETITKVRETASATLKEPGLVMSFAGAPNLQLDIRDAIQRDRLIYNGAGFLVGFFINLIFFGRARLVAVSSLCPAVGVAWALGALGHSGVQLNTLVNVIPPLVMVISFCDSMHLMHRVRRAINDGLDRFAAARIAVLEVGPACALTMVVTAVSALSLAFTDSVMIRNFAFATAASLVLSFFAVMIIVPIATVLTMTNEDKFRATEPKAARNLRILTAFSEHVADFVARYYRPIFLIGMLSTAAFFALHWQLEPRYRLSEQTPTGSQSAAATLALDAKLGGAQPLYVMVTWPPGRDARTNDVKAAIAEAHEAMRLQPGVVNVWSQKTMEEWITGAGVSDEPEIKRILDTLPDTVRKRLVNEDGRAALLTGYIRDMSAHDAAIIVHGLEAPLARLEKAYPGLDFSIAGLSAVSALQSTSMIAQLNWNLIGSILGVMLIIAIAFRSLEIAVLSAVPNLFPIFAAGAVLFWLGAGIEYASVIALDIAFGLAIDDTIHFLNHLRHERQHTSRLADAVRGTIRLMGPVVIMATVVLVLGLSVTILSDLPQMRLFGYLMMGALTAAILGDLLLLPAIFLFLKTRFRGTSDAPVAARA